GLGSSATKDVGTAAGNVMQVGAFGLGASVYDSGPSTPAAEANANYMAVNGIFSAPGASASNYASAYAPVMIMTRGTSIAQLQVTGIGGVVARYRDAGNWSSWATHYHTNNTTKASDGTLKAASPVARIVKSREETERTDVAEDGFTWCGCGTANAEAEGITLSRRDVGFYVLTGSAGLASEGWQLLPPMDPGGMGELGVVEAEQTDNGELTIRLFKRKYMLSDDGEIIKTKGELMDVPANSWIDVRLDMPSDSLFNQRMNQELQP
ncbi:phage tail protein, partial [Enterobacter cloacae]